MTLKPSPVGRRAFLAAIPAAGLALYSARPAFAAAVTSPGAITLPPGGSATVTFPVTAAGYVISASVHTTQDGFAPFVSAVVSWPSGPSQRWVLGGSPAFGGQRYKGSGPAQGASMTVKVTSFDDTPVTVTFDAHGSGSAASWHDWRQVSNRPGGLYPCGSMDAGAGTLLSTRADVGAAALALRAVPLYAGAVTVRARSLDGQPGHLYLSSLDPANPGPLLRADLPVAQKLTLPRVPCLLTIGNTGSHAGRFAATVRMP